MYIRIANITDLPAVIDLMKRVIPVMQKDGNDQWDDKYPTADIIRQDINELDLFVLMLDEKIVGAVVINAILPKEYCSIRWKTSPNTYTFHRMMVDPEYQGKGIATAILQFIEKRGINMGMKSLRVDTNENNTKMLALFEKFKFSNAGTINLMGKTSKFLCFEKTLS